MSKRRNLSCPLPDSKVFNASNSFIKKNRPNGTDPKIKKCPPAPKPSRTISRRISFTSSVNLISFDKTGNLSSLYNSKSELPYLIQCFDLIDKIGEGSFGEVWRAKFRQDGEIYAIKKTKERLTYGRRVKMNEVRNIEKVPKNPYCVQFHCAWEEEDYLYMQLEYCDTSLDKYASENAKIKEDELWCILLDCLLGLKTLHDNQLVHRDVKPGNIMKSTSGICKLGDFGLLCDLKERENIPDWDCEDGDAKYLAPEALKGNSAISPALDIFSLGITMLELATNYELPGNGPVWSSLRNNCFPAEFQNEVSPQLFHIITEMMQKDPKVRPTVDQLLALKPLQYLHKRRNILIILDKNVKIYILSVVQLIWSKFLILLQWIRPHLWNDVNRLTVNNNIVACEDLSDSKAASNVPMIVIDSPDSSSVLDDDTAESSSRSSHLLTSGSDNDADDLCEFSPILQSTPISHIGHDNNYRNVSAISGRDISKVRISLFSSGGDDDDDDDEEEEDDTMITY